MSMCWLWCHQYNKHALYLYNTSSWTWLLTHCCPPYLILMFVCVLSRRNGSAVPTMPQLPVMSMVPNVPEVPELQMQSKINLHLAPKIQINSINSAAAEHGIWVKIIIMFSGTSLSVKTLVLSLDCSSFSNKLLAEKSSVFMFLWAFLCGLDRTLLAMQQNLQWILCKRTLGSILAVISRMTRRFDTKRDDILL